MRKFLIMLLIVILIAVLGIMIASGISFGSFEIPSITQIIESNKGLDSQIASLEASINSDYASAQSALDASVKTLQTSKQSYQDAITYSTEEEIKAANQTEEYKIGYLWTKIGLYATNNNVTMQANVSNGSVEGKYNISFTAMGEYISISEFIYAIENDSNLGFKIEDFALVPYSEEQLQASFVIRNISIDKDSLTAITTTTNDNSQTTTTTEDSNTITEDSDTNDVGNTTVEY